MDEQLKYQITGAVIWFVLTAWFVGDWYAHPVNFSPEGTLIQQAVQPKPIVHHPLKIEMPVKQLPAKQTAVRAQPIPGSQPEVPTEPVHEIQKDEKSAPLTKPAQSKQQKTEQAGQQGYLVKVAAYFTEAQANKLAATLNELGYDARYKTFKTFKNAKGQTVYSVRVGPFTSKARAQAVKKKLDRRFYTDCKIEPISQTEKK